MKRRLLAHGTEQAGLLGRLEEKLKRTESRIEVVRTTILKHRARLAFLSRKYPDEGPAQDRLSGVA